MVWMRPIGFIYTEYYCEHDLRPSRPGATLLSVYRRVKNHKNHVLWVFSMIQKLLNFRFWGMHCIPTMDMARVIDLNPCMIHHQGGDDALLARWDKRPTPRPGLAHRGFGNSYISRFLSFLAILEMENQDIKVDWAPMLAKRLCSGRKTWTRQMGKSETYKHTICGARKSWQIWVFSHFPEVQTFEKMHVSSIFKGLSQKPQCSHALASNANIYESAQLVLSAVPRLNSFIMSRNDA